MAHYAKREMSSSGAPASSPSSTSALVAARAVAATEHSRKGALWLLSRSPVAQEFLPRADTGQLLSPANSSSTRFTVAQT
jgi:hypothetical protein